MQADCHALLYWSKVTLSVHIGSFARRVGRAFTLTGDHHGMRQYILFVSMHSLLLCCLCHVSAFIKCYTCMQCYNMLWFCLSKRHKLLCQRQGQPRQPSCTPCRPQLASGGQKLGQDSARTCPNVRRLTHACNWPTRVYKSLNKHTDTHTHTHTNNAVTCWYTSRPWRMR